MVRPTDKDRKTGIDLAQDYANKLRDGGKPDFLMFLLKEALNDAGLNPESDDSYKAVGFEDGLEEVQQTCRANFENAARHYTDRLVERQGEPRAAWDMVQMNMSRAGLSPEHDENWFKIHPEGRHGVHAYFMEACEDKAALWFEKYQQGKETGAIGSALESVISYMRSAELDITSDEDWQRVGALDGIPEEARSKLSYKAALKENEMPETESAPPAPKPQTLVLS